LQGFVAAAGMVLGFGGEEEGFAAAIRVRVGVPGAVMWRMTTIVMVPWSMWRRR